MSAWWLNEPEPYDRLVDTFESDYIALPGGTWQLEVAWITFMDAEPGEWATCEECGGTGVRDAYMGFDNWLYEEGDCPICKGSGLYFVEPGS